jgi:hypothetical protein
MKLGISEPISVAYFINPSHQSVCVYVYPTYRLKVTARQNISLFPLLGNGSVKTFPQQRIHGAIEEFLNSSLSMRSMSMLLGIIIIIICGVGLSP